MLHKNKAARHKSRLSANVKKMTDGQAAVVTKAKTSKAKPAAAKTAKAAKASKAAKSAKTAK
jgi:hypothetical protein